MSILEKALKKLGYNHIGRINRQQAFTKKEGAFGIVFLFTDDLTTEITQTWFIPAESAIIEKRVKKDLKYLEKFESRS